MKSLHLLPADLAIKFRSMGDFAVFERANRQQPGFVLHEARPRSRRNVDDRTMYRMTMQANPVYIPQTISRVIQQSVKILAGTDRRRVRSALHELLLNAVEHGALEVGFQEKRQALADGRYDELLSERLNSDLFKRRLIFVCILYDREDKCLTYSVVDEGEGFSWRQLFASLRDVCKFDAANGRGVFLARSLFPSLRYNDLGNEATITVPLD